VVRPSRIKKLEKILIKILEEEKEQKNGKSHSHPQKANGHK